jgi:hypothetical protein
MKKSLIGAMMLAGVVFLSGCGSQTAPEVKTGGPAAPANEAKEEGNLLLDTADRIKSAMLGGAKMECTFQEKGDDGQMTEVKLQSQGEKFRSSYAVKGETFISVSDGKTIYSWSTKTKEGQKMELKCMEDLAKDVPQAEKATEDKFEFDDPETLVDEQPDMKCSPILSLDLSVPNDVKFTDACAEMKKLFDSMKDLNVNLPQGVNIPQAE